MMSSIKRITLATAFLMVAVLSIKAATQDYFVADLFLTKTMQDAMGSLRWEELMEVVSFIGQTSVLVALALPLFTWFLWRNQRPEAFAVLGGLLSLGINPILKIIVNRPRPPDDLVTVWRDFGGLGFPSGHAFSAVVLFGIAFYLAPLLVPWRAAAYVTRAALILMTLLIGASRVYLGTHWPSDVLGGFLYGIIVLIFLISSYEWLSRTYGRRTEVRP